MTKYIYATYMKDGKLKHSEFESKTYAMKFCELFGIKKMNVHWTSRVNALRKAWDVESYRDATMFSLIIGQIVLSKNGKARYVKRECDGYDYYDAKTAKWEAEIEARYHPKTTETPSQTTEEPKTTTEVTVTTEEVATETVQNHAETTIEANETVEPTQNTTEPDKSLKTAGIGVYAKIYDTATGLIVHVKNKDFNLSTHAKIETIHPMQVVQKNGLRYYHLVMENSKGLTVGTANVDDYELHLTKTFECPIRHDKSLTCGVGH